MLVLTRRMNESITLTGGITVTVMDIRKDRIRIGVEAPDEVNIVRSELLTRGTDARRDVTGRVVSAGAERLAGLE